MPVKAVSYIHMSSEVHLPFWEESLHTISSKAELIRNQADSTVSGATNNLFQHIPTSTRLLEIFMIFSPPFGNGWSWFQAERSNPLSGSS